RHDLAARDEHELPGRRAAHGGLMHADTLANLGAREWPQLLDAVLEAFLLALHDDFGDARDRLTALVDVVDEELRARHVVADVLLVLVGHRQRLAALAARRLHLRNELAVHRVHTQREAA